MSLGAATEEMGADTNTLYRSAILLGLFIEVA